MDRGARVFWASLVLVMGIMIATVFRNSTGKPPAPSELSGTGNPGTFITHRVRRLPPVTRSGSASFPSGNTGKTGGDRTPPVDLALGISAGQPGDQRQWKTAPPPKLDDRYPASPSAGSGWVPAIGLERSESAAATSVVHRVQDGDTLPELAARYLGDPNRFMEIFEANRHVLASPDLLPIGVELIIPRSAPSGSSHAPPTDLQAKY